MLSLVPVVFKNYIGLPQWRNIRSCWPSPLPVATSCHWNVLPNTLSHTLTKYVVFVKLVDSIFVLTSGAVHGGKTAELQQNRTLILSTVDARQHAVVLLFKPVQTLLLLLCIHYLRLNFRQNHMNIARERWRMTVKLSKLYRIWRVHSKKTEAGFTYLQKSTTTMTTYVCLYCREYLGHWYLQCTNCTYDTCTDTCMYDVSRSTCSLLIASGGHKGRQWGP